VRKGIAILVLDGNITARFRINYCSAEKVLPLARLPVAPTNLRHAQFNCATASRMAQFHRCVAGLQMWISAFVLNDSVSIYPNGALRHSYCVTTGSGLTRIFLYNQFYGKSFRH
jgi:hypothetical protein